MTTENETFYCGCEDCSKTKPCNAANTPCQKYEREFFGCKKCTCPSKAKPLIPDLNPCLSCHKVPNWSYLSHSHCAKITCSSPICRRLIIESQDPEFAVSVWNNANPLPEPAHESESVTDPKQEGTQNLAPSSDPCTCPGFSSPLQYQVGGNHYRRLQYQPIELIHDLGLDFDRANAIKYLSRLGHKGDPLEDLKKAKQYLEFYQESKDKKREKTRVFAEQFPFPISKCIWYILIDYEESVLGDIPILIHEFEVNPERMMEVFNDN